MVDSPQDPAPPAPVATNASEQRALRWLAWSALALILWIAHPLGVGLFLGVLLAFTLQPFDRALRARQWQRGSSALVCVLSAMLATVLALVGFAFVFVGRAVRLSEEVPAQLAPGGPLRGFLERTLAMIHVHPDSAIAELQGQAAEIGTRAAGMAADVAGLTLDGLLALFFMGLAACYVLRHWEGIVHHAELLMPFAPEHTRTFLGEFRAVGRSVLRGTVWTGLLQGTLAALGYWICGIDDPAFFGALTCVASLVPAVGTLMVWVPAGIYLLATDHLVMGIVLLSYGGLVVVGLVDYVVRPALIGREANMPAILTFVGLFGGIEVFGLMGLVLGPVLVTLCVAVLKTYEAQSIARDAAGVSRTANLP